MLTLVSCEAEGTEYNAGGDIMVNNWEVEVPKNLIVQFPVVWAPFRELCNAGALGFETTVVGNIVNGKVLAGQISVAQRFGLEGSQGYISAINADGTLQISGGGPKVRINDPDGFFGPQFEGQRYWIADTASPSVTSFSGFPMCIPYSGNTEKCRLSNRLNSQSFSPPDPLSMVPFKVGDFIEYSGLKVGGNEILASSIVCISLHITTQAGDNVPNYIRVEDMLVGVPDNAANVEFADIRVIGFLSSCAGAVVTISAIEVDPCTGKETYRSIARLTPNKRRAANGKLVSRRKLRRRLLVSTASRPTPRSKRRRTVSRLASSLQLSANGFSRRSMFPEPIRLHTPSMTFEAWSRATSSMASSMVLCRPSPVLIHLHHQRRAVPLTFPIQMPHQRLHLHRTPTHRRSLR
jgi:hypothetical protein